MKTEHFNGLGEDEQERLVLLAEDCAEIVHMVMKILRHGFESSDPTKYNGPTNRMLLSTEIGQLEWVCDQMKKSKDLSKAFIRTAFDKRGNDIKGYLHHHKVIEE